MSAVTSFLRTRPGRRASKVGLLLVVAVAMSGCVSYSSQPTLTQVGDLGGLRFSASACSTGFSADPAPCSPTDTNGGFPTSTRLLAAVQVPTDTTPSDTTSVELNIPEQVTHDDATTTSTTTVLFARNASYEARLAAAEAPAAGYRWVGYVSEVVAYGDNEMISSSGTIDFAPAFAADGSTVASTVNWVSGLASTDTLTAPTGTRTSATISCSNVSECLGDRRTGTTPLRSLVTRAVAASSTVTAGTTTPVTFTTKLAGGALPSGPSIAVTGTSSITGAVVTGTSVSPAVGVDTPVSVQLAVPASTPVGTKGTVTITLTTASGEKRSASANVVTAAPPLVVKLPARPRAFSITPITRCVSTRFRAATLRYTTAEDLTATVLLQRRSARGALLRKCPSSVSGASGTKAPTYTTTARSVSKVYVGTHTVRLADLRPKVTLKPGVYRLLVQLRRANGTPAPTVTQTFIVLAK